MADMEHSKLHYEMRALRTRFHRYALVVATNMLTVLIGLGIAGISAAISIAAAEIHKSIGPTTADRMARGDTLGAFVSFVGLRLACVAGAAALIAWEPSAWGSGLPRVKSNLNGAEMPSSFL